MREKQCDKESQIDFLSDPAIMVPFTVGCFYMTDILTIRIEAARDALSRTRYAFVVATIVSVAIIVAEFNSTFSWYSQFPDLAPVGQAHQTAASSQSLQPPELVSKPAADDHSLKQLARETVVQEWVKSNRMAVSLLGVNFGMSDAPLLGSLSLAIISLWFYVCIRRENHLVASILRDVRAADRAAQQKAFYGITGYLVFTTMTDGDEPIFSLDQPIGHKAFYLRPYIRILIYLPAITIAFIVLSDAFSLLMPPEVREAAGSTKTLLNIIYNGPTRWFVQLLFMEGVALLFFGVTLSICMNISRFERATGHLLKKFYIAHRSSWDSPIGT